MIIKELDGMPVVVKEMPREWQLARTGRWRPAVPIHDDQSFRRMTTSLAKIERRPATATGLPTFRMTNHATVATILSALRTKSGRYSYDGMPEIAAVALSARQGGSHARKRIQNHRA